MIISYYILFISWLFICSAGGGQIPPKKRLKKKRGPRVRPGQEVFGRHVRFNLRSFSTEIMGCLAKTSGVIASIWSEKCILAHNSPACIKRQQQRCWCRKPWQIKRLKFPTELSNLQPVQACRVTAVNRVVVRNENPWKNRRGRSGEMRVFRPRKWKVNLQTWIDHIFFLVESSVCGQNHGKGGLFDDV